MVTTPNSILLTKTWVLFSILFAISSGIDAFGQEKDTILPNGRLGTLKYALVPCDCDSLRHDSDAIRQNLCMDTSFYVLLTPSILDVADSIAQVFDVPYDLIYEVGMNESRWQNIYDMNYVIKDGDLQVIDRTFNVLYKELNLSGGKTRENYLMIGIYYLRKNYDVYGSWRKARYAYGRGRWKPESQWTSMERHFMNKIDWSKYDATANDN
jgi:Transglycosylase SLT domain